MNKATTPYAERKRRGHCVDCSEPAAQGLVFCAYHRERRKKASRDRRDRLRSAGKCLTCASTLTNRKAYCDKCSTRIDTYHKQLRNNRISDDTCVRCGKSKLPSILLCESCWFESVAVRSLGSSLHTMKLKDLFYLQGGKCVYSGLPLVLGDTASVDHIDPNGSRDDISNVQWVHISINRIKTKKNDEQFKRYVKATYEKRGAFLHHIYNNLGMSL